MSSILTNNSAMVALQTLKTINGDLSKTQREIATGKSVATAKDNAATWAISKVMESDVKGFKAISDSLALGESTVAVARQASETVTDLLTEIKGKVVAAQEENVDRAKIQTDIGQLRDQITSVVNSAQFNGLNMVDGSATSPVEVLSSLDRAADGTVQSANISVDLANTDLSGSSGTDLNGSNSAAAFDNGGTAAAAVTLADGASDTLSNFGFVQSDGTDGTTATDPALREGDLTAAAGTASLMAGDRVELDVGGTMVSYTVREGDSGSAISGALRNELEAAGLSGDIGVGFDANGLLEITNNTGGTLDLEVSATRGEGGLADLQTLNVAGTETERTDALRDIESMIQYAIDASSQFGSAQQRIDIQKDFVGNLMDAMKSGIGSMVDANMEESSARLQSLQVQQQLATQSLSIANQAPQSILSLFR